MGGSRLTMGGTTTESKCKECGAVYMKSDEHAYNGCCSWHCMRAQEAKEKKRKKGYCLGVKVILQRIERCEERIAHHQAVVDEAQPGTKLRSNSIRQLREWKEKLEDYEIQLVEAEDD